MATEKIINTRIQLKYDTLENWNNNSSLILRKGEVGICAVPRGGSLEQTTPPAIMFKVGDGVVDAQGNVTGTQFKDLPWASALAADVYAWAKAETKPTYDYSELTGTPTIPTVGSGKITINQAGVKKGEFTVNQTGNTTIELTDNNTDTNTRYQLTLNDHTLTLQSKEIGAENWTKVQDLTLPDNDTNTTYTFATGDTDGTFKVTPSGGSAQNVKIKNVMVSTGGAFSGAVTVQAPTEAMNPATKQYVDTAIGKINSFEYVVVQDALPTASKDTMYKIYLVADSTNKESQDNYDEYITVLTGTSTYTWEKIGNTTLDLSNYVNALSGTANSGVVTNISKSGNTISVTSTSLATSSPAASGDAKSFIDTIKQDANGKIIATKKSVSTMTGALESKAGSAGLVPAPAAGDQRKFLRGDGTWVVPTNTDSLVDLTAKNETTKAYLLATTADPTAIAKSTTGVADTGVYLGTSAGQLVATEFKGKLTGNADTATKLNLGVEIDGVEFDGSGSITHYGDCDTAAGTAEKTVICSWFKLVYGARIAVKFTKSNSASNPTLNVHGTGAKPIYYRGAPIPANYLAANRTYEFIYNDAQYELVGDINTDTGVTDVEFTGSGNAVTNASISGRKMTLTKGATFLTSHQDISGKQDKITSTNKLSASLVSGLATVATSGSYNDLSDKPDNATTSTAGLMSAADKTKLDGIATGATKVTDATVSGWGYIKSYTDTNQKISSGTTTFGANDTIEIKAGTNITVDASSATKTITINGKSNDEINSLITEKINTLDVSNITGFSAGKTLKTLTETDGKIAATFQDISITASQVSDFNTKVDARISTYAGVDKTGTVTSVSAGTGLKITGTATTTPKVEIDDSVVFVFNCGSATVNV